MEEEWEEEEKGGDANEGKKEAEENEGMQNRDRIREGVHIDKEEKENERRKKKKIGKAGERKRKG